MKKKDFENYIKSLTPKLYSFSYALIPDDLQAQQLVIDALTVVFLQEKGLITPILKDKGTETKRENDFFLLEKALFKHVYRLGKKRFYQLQESFFCEKLFEGNFAPFYQLEILERSILYLKEKALFPTPDICSILNLKEADLQEKLNAGRGKFLKLIGHDQDVLDELA